MYIDAQSFSDVTCQNKINLCCFTSFEQKLQNFVSPTSFQLPCNFYKCNSQHSPLVSMASIYELRTYVQLAIFGSFNKTVVYHLIIPWIQGDTSEKQEVDWRWKRREAKLSSSVCFFI
jgi:hypothetical protein